MRSEFEPIGLMDRLATDPDLLRFDLCPAQLIPSSVRILKSANVGDEACDIAGRQSVFRGAAIDEIPVPGEWDEIGTNVLRVRDVGHGYEWRAIGKSQSRILGVVSKAEALGPVQTRLLGYRNFKHSTPNDIARDIGTKRVALRRPVPAGLVEAKLMTWQFRRGQKSAGGNAKAEALRTQVRAVGEVMKACHVAGPIT